MFLTLSKAIAKIKTARWDYALRAACAVAAIHPKERAEKKAEPIGSGSSVARTEKLCKPNVMLEGDHPTRRAC
jgi:hypothetical protein